MLKRLLGWASAAGFLVTAAVLVGCPSSPPPAAPLDSGPPASVSTPSPAPSPAPAPTVGAPPAAAHKGCGADADCPSGQMCTFTPGCEAPGTCAPPRRCTRDLVEYCACDGTTFRGSSTCPVKAYRSRGKC